MKKKIVISFLFLIIFLGGFLFWKSSPFSFFKKNDRQTFQEEIALEEIFLNIEKYLERIKVKEEIPQEIREKFLKQLEKIKEKIKNTPPEKNFYNFLDLGIVLNELGDKEKTVWAYQIAGKISPKNFPSFYNQGVVLIDLKRYNEAEEVLLQAKENAPKEVIVYLRIGELYRKYLKKSKEEIEEIYLEGIKNTHHPTLIKELASFYQEIGEENLARQYYFQAQEAEKNLPEKIKL